MKALARLVRTGMRLTGLTRPTPMTPAPVTFAVSKVMFVPGPLSEDGGPPSLSHMREHGVDVTDYFVTEPVLDMTTSPVDATPSGFVWCQNCGVHHAIKASTDSLSLCPSCSPHSFLSWADRR